MFNDFPLLSPRTRPPLHAMVEGESEVEKELSLLKRRWGCNLEVLGIQYEGDQGSAACFTLKMPPSDPDFSHDIGGFLNLTITLPVGYPLTTPCEVVVTNDSINQQVRGALGKAIAAEARGLVGRIMVRDVIKFIDNNLAMLFDCALEVISSAAQTSLLAPGRVAGTAGVETAATGGDDACADWSAEQQKCLEAALREVPASIEAGERWRLIAAKVPDKTKKECVARFKQLKSVLSQQAAGAREGDKAGESGTGVAGKAAAGGTEEPKGTRADAGREGCEGYTTSESGTVRAAGAARNSLLPLPDEPYEPPAQTGPERHAKCTYLQSEAARTSAAPAVGVSVGWSEADQRALEHALEEFPATLPKAERWRRIALQVPGKSVRECYVRGKEMKVRLRRELLGLSREAASAGGVGAGGAGGLKAKGTVFRFDVDVAATAGDGCEEGSEADEAGEGRTDEPGSEEDEEESEESEESEGEGEEGEKSHIRALNSDIGADGRVSLTGHHRGTHIKLNDPLLHGVSVVQLAVARVQCTCIRCSLKFDVTLARGRELVEDCPRCRLSRFVRLRADVVHANNASACYVDAEGCRVQDLLPSDFWLACAACGAETCLRRLQRGRRAQEVCRGCFAKLSLGFGGVNIHLISSQPSGGGSGGGGGGGGGRKKNAGKQRDMELVPGTPLPNRGVCEHYKRSTRWLRFPCCGKAFPCDICHEKGSDGCPPGTWANRMICGLCSVEQAYSNKACACGATFGSGASKTHWEGGAGCRDKTRMSNKDSKKYAGTAKTISRKALAKPKP